MNVAKRDSAHWEIGSEFHWTRLPEPPLLQWQKPAVWYTLARHAVAALAQMKSENGPTLWLPTYFCPEVAECCRAFCPVREYRDLPTWSEPDWASLQVQKNDIVLSVNYFGIREDAPWKQWREHHDCVLLEDHSHDPFSEWARNSTADYAFASARKTLPIPDGAALWSPRELRLPDQRADGDWNGSALKLASMIYKAEYLRGKSTDGLKTKFRDLQLGGERLLRTSRISAISPGSFAYIAEGVPESWRHQRQANAQYLRCKLLAGTSQQPMFRQWHDCAVPFALPIVFASQVERDACQSHLRNSKIYCPVHWVCQTSDLDALHLSQTVLSLPVDQRYTNDDMQRIVDVLQQAETQETVVRGVAR